MINPNSPVLLEVRGLCASVNGIDILKGLDFTVRRGEVHAIMGPNGSGKSTFAKVLAGHTAYTVTAGTMQFEGQDLLALAPEARALAGVFLGFQYPIEIPGVVNSQFLRLSYNTLQAQRGISAEAAVSMIINGFCKDVFQQLPMEFAVEATQLLGFKLEGAVG